MKEVVREEPCRDGARVLVLGADGFIGRRVVMSLKQSGWAKVVAVGRRPGPAISDVERLVCDARDPDRLVPLLREADGVVSCVAGNAETLVGHARALFAALGEASPPRIVYLSSMAVYGAARGHVDEAHALSGETGPYAAAKVEAERLAAAHPNVVVLRPGIVYGPGSVQWSGRIACWLRSRRVGDLGAAGDGWCNLVHVDDVAAAALLALRSPDGAGEAFNLSCDDPLTWNEYFVRFAKALGAVPVATVPERRLRLETRLFAPPLKVAQLVAARLRLRGLALPEPIPPSLLALWRLEQRLDIAKTRDRLGLVGRPLDIGLAQAAAAYPPPG